MTLLVLDLDGTLTKSDNIVRFSFFMAQRNWWFNIALPLFVLLKIGFINNIQFKNYYAKLILKGFDVKYIKACACEYAKSQEVENDFNHEVLDFINQYPESAKVVISANFEFLVQPICDVLGIEDYRAIKLEEEKGIFTGVILGTIPYGEDKVEVYKNLSKETSCRHSIGLGDSISDLPLLNYLNEGFLVSFKKSKKITRINSVKNNEKEEGF